MKWLGENWKEWLMHQVAARAEGSLVKFNTKRCKRKSNPRHPRYREGVSSLERSFAEQVLGVLVDTRVKRSLLCAAMAEVGTVSWLRQGERCSRSRGSFPAAQHR